MALDVDLLALAREREGELVEFARRLMQTPSPSGEEGDAAALVQEEMRRLGYDEVRADEVGNVIGLIRGKGSQRGSANGHSVMLNTHLDHVSPGDLALWTDPPFSATVRDGAIYGRGAVDIKGPMACQVHAGGLLLATGLRPAGDLYVVGAVLEERGGLGSQHLARTLKTDRAVIGEPSSNTLRRGHRGRVGLVVEVRGRAAHASVPARGVNPHYGLAAFLTRLENLPMPAQEPFGPSSVAPTLYSTDNTSPNVIPSAARVALDWRNIPVQSPNDILAALRPLLQESLRASLPEGATGEVRVDTENLTSYTGIAEDFPSIFPSFALGEDDPVLLTARRALEELLGRPFPPDIWSFATDGGHLMAVGVPTVGFGPGDETQAHVADEHIEIAEMVEALAANAALALALSRAS
jgi:succinyl-diaminopimelate desuccinylase